MSDKPSGSTTKFIKQTIIDDAKAEAEIIIRNAESSAKQLSETALVNARNDLAGWADRQKKMAQNAGDRITGKANNDAHMKLLDAKARIISEAFDTAQNQFGKERGKAQYKAFLKGLIIAAGTQIGGGNLVVFSHKADQDTITKLTGLTTAIAKESGNKSKITIGKKPIATLGGVFVQNQEGNIIVDYRLETLLNQVEQQRRTVIAQALFGEAA